MKKKEKLSQIWTSEELDNIKYLFTESKCGRPRVSGSYKPSIELTFPYSDVTFCMLQEVSDILKTKAINLEANTKEGYYGEVTGYITLSVTMPSL